MRRGMELLRDPVRLYEEEEPLDVVLFGHVEHAEKAAAGKPLKEFVGMSDEEILDEIFGQWASSPIVLSEPSLRLPPEENAGRYIVRQIRTFTGSEHLLRHKPKLYTLWDPYGRLTYEPETGEGGICASLSIEESIMDDPPSSKELAEAFARNDRALTDIAEIANGLARESNERMKQKLGEAIARRRSRQKKMQEAYG